MISGLKWKKIGKSLLFSGGMNNFGLNCKCWTEVGPSKYTQKKLSLVLTPGGVNAVLSNGYDNKSNESSSSWVNPKKFAKLLKVTGIKDTHRVTLQNRLTCLHNSDPSPVSQYVTKRDT